MKKSARFVSLAASLSLLALPLPAAAQEGCISEAQVSALLVYVVPVALPAIREHCSSSVSSNGFFANGAAQMAAQYAAQAESAWPMARQAFLLFAGRNTAELGGLSDRALRPLIDEIVATKIVSEVSLDKCSKIERVLEALVPLEPGESGNLVAVIASMTNPRNPSICTEQN